MNNLIIGYGATIYNNPSLDLFTASVPQGESEISQAENLNDSVVFKQITKTAFTSIKNDLRAAGLFSAQMQFHINDFEKIILESKQNNVHQLTTLLDNKFSRILADEKIISTEKAILLTSLEIYKHSLIYWESNLNKWADLYVGGEVNRVKEPDLDYATIGAADAIGAVRGGVAGAAGGAVVGGIGAVPGAICGGLAGAAQGSAVAAGAQLLVWAWDSIWD